MRPRRRLATVVAALAVFGGLVGSACSADDPAPAAGSSSVAGTTTTGSASNPADGPTADEGDGSDVVATTTSEVGAASTAATSTVGGPGVTVPAAERDGPLELDQWRRHVLDDARPNRSIFVTGADLDEDGDTDVVSGAWWYENPGTNDGTWQRREFGSLQNHAIVGDLDEDGHLDVLGTEGVGSAANADFVFARGGGDGSFAVVDAVATTDGDFLQGACVARFEPDGRMQIALSWHSAGRGIQLMTVSDNPSEDPWPWEQIEEFSQDEALSCGDIDADGDEDLLLGTRWLRNDPGGWSLQRVADVEGSPDRNRLADMNGDGRLDAVVGFEAISIEGKLAWYEQPESLVEPWPERMIANDIVGPMSVGVADLDRDGDADVVVGEHNLTRPADARLLVFENADGLGLTWRAHEIHVGDEHHDGAEIVDIDSDGDLDILSIGWSHDRVVLYENLSS